MRRWLYGALYLRHSARSGLLLCRGRWEIDSDSGLPLSVEAAPYRLCAERSRKEFWLGHAGSVPQPVKFKLELTIHVAVNAWRLNASF